MAPVLGTPDGEPIVSTLEGQTMNTHTTSGQWLARAGGLLCAGAAAYVLTQDAIHSGKWTTDDLLMLPLVAVTILASHLVGNARRARAWGAVAGFCLLALIGTALIVYTSVGRQARIADAEDAHAADVAKRIKDIEADIAAITKKRDDASVVIEHERKRLATECSTGKGTKCDGTRYSIGVYEAAVKGHEADIERKRRDLDRIGPVPVTGARAVRMATVIAMFSSQEAALKARLTRIFRELEPFAFSLLWEIGAAINLGYGFRHRRSNHVRPTIAETAQTSFPATVASALPPPALFDRQSLPEIDAIPTPPTGPKGGNRHRQPLPSNVIPIGKHPVIAALESAGGTVASNKALAEIMCVTPGESTKRVQEVAKLVDVRRVGRETRISLRR